MTFKTRRLTFNSVAPMHGAVPFNSIAIDSSRVEPNFY